MASKGKLLIEYTYGQWKGKQKEVYEGTAKALIGLKRAKKVVKKETK